MPEMSILVACRLLDVAINSSVCLFLGNDTFTVGCLYMQLYWFLDSLHFSLIMGEPDSLSFCHWVRFRQWDALTHARPYNRWKWDCQCWRCNRTIGYRCLDVEAPLKLNVAVFAVLRVCITAGRRLLFHAGNSTPYPPVDPTIGALWGRCVGVGMYCGELLDNWRTYILPFSRLRCLLTRVNTVDIQVPVSGRMFEKLNSYGPLVILALGSRPIVHLYV